MREIKKILVAGAGTMGYSMAETFARFGYGVLLYDMYAQALEGAKKRLDLSLEVQISQGSLTRAQAGEIMDRIELTSEKGGFGEVDFVVEAIVEDLEAKQAFWEEVSGLVDPDIVLTSNTSGISISQIARRVKNPKRFCGMHWINPPHIIPLIEVIEGEETQKEASQLVRDLALSVGKKPVLVKDAPGFVLNRIQFAIMREALHIVDEGIASVEALDDVMRYGLGLRYACLGPFQIADLGGLDIFYRIASYLFEDLADSKEVFGLLADHYEKGEWGVKTSRGFYDYGQGRGEDLIRYRDKTFSQLASLLYQEQDQGENK